MTVVPKTLVLSAFAVLALSACGGGSTLTEGPDSIAIQIDDAKDLGPASRDAAEYCEDTDRQAVLIRTDEVGQEAVAYFECQ